VDVCGVTWCCGEFPSALIWTSGFDVIDKPRTTLEISASMRVGACTVRARRWRRSSSPGLLASSRMMIEQSTTQVTGGRPP
jgi:hypothetical protein